MRKIIACLIMQGSLFALLTGCKSKTNQLREVITGGKFRAGQVWKYNSRPGEDSSTFTVLRVEKYEKGDTIVHIRVDGIKMMNPKVPAGYNNFIEHLPYSEKTLSKCATILVRHADTIPDFAEGYNEWRSAWDNGKAGYWTAELKDAIEGVDKAMHKKN